MDTKLAIVCTHPIQYYAPVFKILAQKINLKVFYTKHTVYDKGFQQRIDWDIPLLKGYDSIFAGELVINKIRQFRPNYILIYGWAHLHHLLIILHFSGKIPILFRGDSTILAPSSATKNLFRKLTLNLIYRYIDKALYVGTNNKEYFRRYGFIEHQLFFAPHAIDNTRFAISDSSDIRTTLNIKSHEILVLFAGKFIPIKNPLLLLKAFLDENIPNVHLLFTGDGMLKNQLQRESMNSKNVHFIPFQNQSKMPGIYQACDLFCLPSIADSWGLAVNEAMAAGKAVLVSDRVGAAIDLVRQTNGRIFKHDCLEDLKRNLKAMITNRTDLRQQGEYSRDIIADWNFEVQVDKILHAIYK